MPHPCGDPLIQSDAELKTIESIPFQSNATNARMQPHEKLDPLIGRSSDPLEDTLARLMDGLSDISQSGNDNNLISARGERDPGTPFMRSPNHSTELCSKEAAPFGQSSAHRHNVKIVGLPRIRNENDSLLKQPGH